ncbi:MAG TPA: alcohol dehydrogenase [Verrucomicrobiales bacterium]|jgi:outer membrane protein assembly factor BamB|nr:alcohol dehydrogenase [Verrucomicrobiales bacterium]
MRQLLILVLLANLAQAEDWPNWRGLRHDGISREAVPKADFSKIAWRAKIGVGFSSMAVADGRVFALGSTGKRRGNQETFTCLNAATGKKIWSDTYPAALVDNLHEGGPCASPTVDGKRVYGFSKSGRLACYNAADGEKHWTVDLMAKAGLPKPPEWGFAGSPLILGNMVIVEATFTCALDKTTGKEIWRSQKYKPAYGSPIAFQFKNKIYLATLKTDGLVILDAQTGKTVAFHDWRTSFRTNSTTPIVIGNKIFISTGYQRGCALFEFTGNGLKQIYTNKNLSNHMNNSVVLGDFVYGFDGNTHGRVPKQIVCMRLADGVVQWRKDGYLCGSLMAVQNQLLILGEKGKLALGPASPKGFTPTAEAQILQGRCWTVPVLSNGRIYARNAAGTLVCVDARK